MAECSLCGEQTSMPFTCKFCEHSYCSKHRLPENHDCQGLENYQEQSHEQGKVGYDVMHTGNSGKPVPPQSDTASVTDRVRNAVPTEIMPARTNLPITYIILGVMLAAFFLQLTVPGFSDAFALDPQKALFQPWILVTSMFLHGGVTHLLVNAIVLFSFGTEVERMLGDRKYLGLLFAAGLASSFGIVLSGYLFNLLTPALGISGALFGLVAFLAVVRPETRVLAFFIIPLKIRTAVAFFGALDLANFITQILGTTELYTILFSIVLNQPGVRIGSIAHLSGLAVGLLYGYYVKDRYRRQRPQGLFNMQTQFRRF